MTDFVAGIAGACWDLFNEMSAYLLFGFFVAGILHVVLKEGFIAKHLGAPGWGSIFKASLFGIPLPLCSCGVLPAALSLRRDGASKSAVFSFLISTPTTGIDSIFATYALLGGFFAVFRVVASFLCAIVVGGTIYLFDRPESRGFTVSAPSVSACPHCEAEKVRSARGERQNFLQISREVFSYGFGRLIRESGLAILIGIAIGGLISYFVPTSFIERYLGNVWLSMLVMMAIGIPMYVCSTGSIPIVAALMLKGLNPGAAFVFLITGPATNSVSFALVLKEFGARAMILFFLSLAVGSLLLGFVFDQAWQMFDIDLMRTLHHHATVLPSVIKIVSSIILILLIAFQCFRFPKQ